MINGMLASLYMQQLTEKMLYISWLVMTMWI
jgi:hypothetical protein